MARKSKRQVSIYKKAVICLIIGVVITIGCMFFLHYGMKNRDTEAA